MAFKPKDNTGSLFKNKDKKTDTHPNARGSAMIGGVEYWIDAWTNYTDGKNDKPVEAYQSLKFKPKDQSGTVKGSQPAKTPTDDSDDVPF